MVDNPILTVILVDYQPLIMAAKLDTVLKVRMVSFYLIHKILVAGQADGNQIRDLEVLS